MICISRLEHASTGYLFAWRADSPDEWQRMLAAVRNLPRGTRRYHEDVKAWWIAGDVRGDIIDIIERLNQSGNTGIRAIIPPDVAQAFHTLHVAMDAPQEVITAAYRVLSKRYHPDTGGSHASMVALNAAYDKALSWAKKAA
jgi:hypothetical protein